MRTMLRPLRTAPIGVPAILAMAILTLGVWTETGGRSSSESVAGADSTTTTPEVVLYYFHGTRRCHTCRTIESYAREAVEGGFQDALRTGTLSWAALNTDEAENAHFVKDFALVSSSLVLVELDAGRVVRHEILQDAWTLVRDKPRFVAYVQKSVGEYLE